MGGQQSSTNFSRKIRADKRVQELYDDVTNPDTQDTGARRLFILDENAMLTRPGKTREKIKNVMKRYGKINSPRSTYLLPVLFKERVIIFYVDIIMAPRENIGSIVFYSAPIWESDRAPLYYNVIFSSKNEMKDLYIDIISALPEHNIPTGTFAVSLVLAMGKALGFKTASLLDASLIFCPPPAPIRVRRLFRKDKIIKEQPRNFSLKIASILSKGDSWYGSLGFKNAALWRLKKRDSKYVEKIIEFVRNITLDELSAYYDFIEGHAQDLTFIEDDGTIIDISFSIIESMLQYRSETVSAAIKFIGREATIKDTVDSLINASRAEDTSACNLLANFTTMFMRPLVYLDKSKSKEDFFTLAMIDIAKIIYFSDMTINLSSI